MQFRNECGKCGATRVDAQIGLEPDPSAYVARLVAVFREVRRVLRRDGTLWLNISDSYARNPGKGGSGPNGKHDYMPDYGNARRILSESRGSSDGAVGRADRAPIRNGAPGLKEKDLVGIPWMLAFALRDDGWYLRSDIIWCLSGGARVYAKTQKGEMPMTIKDMVRLDPSTVKLWNGQKWTQILGWSQTARPEVAYEFELRSGQRIGCTAGHLWPTTRGNVRACEVLLGDVFETCRLPEPSPEMQCAGFPDEEVGWFVGLYIAEGCRHKGAISISSHSKERERYERLCRLAEMYHGACRWSQSGPNKACITLSGQALNAIIDTYVSGELAAGKHLDVRCWARSDKFLRAVLDGYLSGDGHFDTKNERWRLGFCNNDALAEDLRTLCARLGVTLSLRRYLHTMQGRKFPGYRGELRFKRSGHWNERPMAEVVAIRRSHARKFWDIGVEDAPNTFALASGVLTHNSKDSCMPESVTDRPTRSHEYLFLLTKSASYYYDNEAISEAAVMTPQRRFTTSQLRVGVPGQADHNGAKRAREAPAMEYATRNARSVWKFTPAPFSASDLGITDTDHFAAYPPELPQRCILAGTSAYGCCAGCGAGWVRIVEKETRPNVPSLTGKYDGIGKHRTVSGGVTNDARTRVVCGWKPSCKCPRAEKMPVVPAVVLDPFAGTGTTADVAVGNSRDAILIELSEQYARIIRARCGLWMDEHAQAVTP